jgi:hypothetical protein
MSTVAPSELLDLVGRHHRPARRKRKAAAEQIAEQQTVRIDETARALRVARAAHGDDRIQVADEALAHRKVRHVLQHVLGVDDVPVVELFAGHRLDGRRQIRVHGARRAGRIRADPDCRQRGVRDCVLRMSRRRDECRHQRRNEDG